jgi:hypothetical protein
MTTKTISTTQTTITPTAGDGVINIAVSNAVVSASYNLVEAAAEPVNVIINGDFATGDGWDNGAGWTVGAGSAIGSNTSADLSTNNAPLDVSLTYTVQLTVVIVSGYIYVLGGDLGLLTESGTYTDTIYADDHDVNLIISSSNFTGTVDNVSAYILE